jgi:hypothetical protein
MLCVVGGHLMKNEQKNEYVARETILSFLSDAEVARVSTAETAPRLGIGDEYIDLEDLGRGVQRALGTIESAMGRVLPRKAVQDDTWARIVAQLRLPPRQGPSLA